MQGALMGVRGEWWSWKLSLWRHTSWVDIRLPALGVFFFSNLVELFDFCNFRALPWCSGSISLAIIFINKVLITYQKGDEESCVYAKI